jgi:hypothetical protein
LIREGSHLVQRSENKPTETERKLLNAVDNRLDNATIAPEADDLPQLDGAINPGFWDDLRDSLPDWLDEVLAIGLLIFGVLSFLALFDASGAVVAVAWADILRNLFGYGSLVVAGGLFLLGVIILLPKIGIRLQFPPARILAIEIGFLCLLGILHLWPATEDLRTLARNGVGGGVIGWGMAAFPHWLFGRSLGMILLVFLVFLSCLVVLGVQRKQIVTWFLLNGQKLLHYSEKQAKLAEPVVTSKTSSSSMSLSEVSSKHLPFMRIVPKLEHLPPSVRNAVSASEAKEAAIDYSDHPLFQAPSDELKIDFNVIGEVSNKKMEDGARIVIRPDGREKRYFSVAEMKEQKKVGKREKSLPELSLLREEEMSLPDEDEINRNAVLIENTLLEFDVDIDVVNVQVGPTVTRYAVQPYRSKSDGSTERTRLGKIASYHSDLALALSAKRLRLEIPVPGTNYMGIEVPNKRPSMVTLRSVFESKAYYEVSHKSSATPLAIPLGRDVSGEAVTIDLAKMPHLLIAGTTGSGKSVCIAAFAAALLLNNTPDKVKMVMLDPKMVELSRFNGIPHLLGPVETDTERIIGVLKWCTREMDRRYKLLEEHAVRNIDNYNEKFSSRKKNSEYMPHVVIMIDEIGDLMMSQPDDTERTITRLAQMARAVGMHLVVATQRPSVDVITGLIKANFPGRIAFAVASGVDSRVILDTVGAEQLMGRGDMLYQAPDAGAPKRVQGCFVSDEEVRDIVEHWRKWLDVEVELGKAERARTGPWQRGLTRREFLAETDPMLEQAIEYVVETQEASASLIQRHLGLGYPRAARIMDMLEELGVIGEQLPGGRSRRVMIAKGEDPFKRIIDDKLHDNIRKQKRADGFYND